MGNYVQQQTMKQKSITERIELGNKEYFIQINEINNNSELPEHIDFKVSPIAKYALMGIILGVGFIAGVASIYRGNNLSGIIVLVATITFYLLLYFFSHKPREKKYLITKEGIEIDKVKYEWDKIIDLHLTAQKLNRGFLYSICFEYEMKKKEFQLDTMTRSIDEIKQILYLYKNWWIKNTPNTN